MTTKNSESRNLFRLLNGVLFIARLLQNLVKDKACTLRTACNDAYTDVLASMHSYFVRSAVRASMYMLPTRETFLQNVNETGVLSQYDDHHQHINALHCHWWHSKLLDSHLLELYLRHLQALPTGISLA